MSDVLANSIVVLAIALSAGYAVWRLGPRGMRDSVRMRLRKALPRVFGNLSGSTAAGACDACGGCAPAAKNEPAPRKEHAVFWHKKSTR